jgi:hypothetical protein
MINFIIIDLACRKLLHPEIHNRYFQKNIQTEGEALIVITSYKKLIQSIVNFRHFRHSTHWSVKIFFIIQYVAS